VFAVNHYTCITGMFTVLCIQDAERTEKASKRVRQLETVYNNIRLLNDMLKRHQPGTATQSDKEIMKVSLHQLPFTVIFPGLLTTYR